MKKSFLVICLVIILFICNACGRSYFYTYEELSSGLIGIEIVEINDEKEGVRTEKIEILKVLNEVEIEECLNELSKIQFYEISALTSPITVEGKCIKLEYQMSSLIICTYGVCDYNKGMDNFLAWKTGDKEKIELLIISLLGNISE